MARWLSMKGVLSYSCSSIFATLVAVAIIAPVTPQMAAAESQDPVSFSGYLDAIVDHDFNNLPSRKRPYTTQPYYNDEAALNLGYADVTLETDRYRGRLAVQYGSSVIANYSDERHQFWRYIQEGYGGIQISDSWRIDAGIFFSHIGMESWISRDDYTVGRSLISDYSPYYQTGVRSIHDISGRLRIEVLILRGWQNISDQQDPSLGTQVAYKFSPSTKVTHNTFVGNISGTRVYNDFVLSQEITSRFGLDAAFDVGFQNQTSDSHAWWYGWSIIPHYKVDDTVALAGRVEQFSDPHHVVLQSLSDQSFNAVSLSTNIDITLAKDLIWRSEYRAYLSSRDLFPNNDGFSSTDNVVSSSLIYTLR